jgi:hypothetical protein
MSREHDAPKRTTRALSTPGKIPEGRFGVYDGRGNLRGNVGRLATAVTARRFGAIGAKLAKKNGKLAWCGMKE